MDIYAVLLYNIDVTFYILYLQVFHKLIIYLLYKFYVQLGQKNHF